MRTNDEQDRPERWTLKAGARLLAAVDDKAACPLVHFEFASGPVASTPAGSDPA
jgi:hypothetical protein